MTTGLPVLKTSLRNALAGLETGAIQRPSLVVAGATEAQFPILLLEHDEATLSPGQLNRRIHDQCKQVVQRRGWS